VGEQDAVVAPPGQSAGDLTTTPLDRHRLRHWDKCRAQLAFHR
jgi:hypothetical protein